MFGLAAVGAVGVRGEVVGPAAGALVGGLAAAHAGAGVVGVAAARELAQVGAPEGDGLAPELVLEGEEIAVGGLGGAGARGAADDLGELVGGAAQVAGAPQGLGLAVEGRQRVLGGRVDGRIGDAGPLWLCVPQVAV